MVKYGKKYGKIWKKYGKSRWIKKNIKMVENYP